MSTIEMTVTARTFREIQAEIKALEEQADALKQKMIAEMDARGVDEMVAGEYTIRWNLYESSRLDSAKLKAEHSNLYAEYDLDTFSGRLKRAPCVSRSKSAHETPITTHRSRLCHNHSITRSPLQHKT